MTAWMIWATLVGFVLGVAGLAVERLLRAHGRQTRWAWVGALGATLGLQVWSWLRPAREVEPYLSGGVSGIRAFVPEVPQSAIATVHSLLARADGFVEAAWLAGTIVLSAALIAGLLNLERRMRRWPRARVAGEEVSLSHGFGPAVVGFVAPRIVMPRWTLALSPEQLRLAFLHESEHRAARDTLLLLARSVAVVVVPWNAAVWWLASRLRQAVELDCDQRVLLAGASPAAYGELLIDLSADPFVSPLPVAALAKPASLLERRLKMMTTRVNRGGPVRSAFLTAAAALLAIVACQAPAPSAIQDGGSPDGAEVVFGEISLRDQPLEVGLEGRTLSVPGEPLVVLNGVIMEGLALEELDGMDPNSIERIEVLKGAAATGIYGARGSDGVIQIFTREGKDLAFAPADRGSTIRIRGTGSVEGDPTIYIDGKLVRQGSPTTSNRIGSTSSERSRR